MLRADLISIEMKDFDVILGMDFLGEHNAVIDCYHHKVTFRPDGGEKCWKSNFLDRNKT